MDSQQGTAGEPPEDRPAHRPSEASSPWASPDSALVRPADAAEPTSPGSPSPANRSSAPPAWGADAWWADPSAVADPPAPTDPAVPDPTVPDPPSYRGETRGQSPPGHPPPPPPGPLRNPAPPRPGLGDPVPAAPPDPAPGSLPYPPPGPYPYLPEPPRGYRETRPLRFGAAAAGFGAGVLWFLLLLTVAWSSLSAVVITLAGLLAAVGAVAVLAWWGDRGAAAGLAVAAALAVAVLTLASWL